MMKRLLYAVIIAMIAFSCSEEEEVNLTIEEQGSRILTPVDECNLASGYSDWNGATMNIGDTRTFAIEAVSGSIYEWDFDVSKFQVISGLNTNQLTLKAIAKTAGTCVTVNRKELDSFGTARLVCARTGCLGSVPPPPPCRCTSNPYINVELCDSDGRAYWRFSVSGKGNVKKNNIRWFGSHLQFKTNSVGAEYVVVEPTDNGYGFRLSVELTDDCGAKRTAYYENYEGGSCSNNSAVRRGVTSCTISGGGGGGGGISPDLR